MLRAVRFSRAIPLWVIILLIFGGVGCDMLPTSQNQQVAIDEAVAQTVAAQAPQPTEGSDSDGLTTGTGNNPDNLPCSADALVLTMAGFNQLSSYLDNEAANLIPSGIADAQPIPLWTSTTEVELEDGAPQEFRVKSIGYLGGEVGSEYIWIDNVFYSRIGSGDWTIDSGKNGNDFQIPTDQIGFYEALQTYPCTLTMTEEQGGLVKTYRYEFPYFDPSLWQTHVHDWGSYLTSTATGQPVVAESGAYRATIVDSGGGNLEIEEEVTIPQRLSDAEGDITVFQMIRQFSRFNEPFGIAAPQIGQ